jgi:membrane associated rhomboid family serine protease
MNIFDNIKLSFRQGSNLIKLIYINAGVFLLYHAILIAFKLFNSGGIFLLPFMAMPADGLQLLYHFWTPVTYMFMHEGFLHLFFNMLCLYWFGKIFLMYYSEKQLTGLYLVGGWMAGLFYFLSFNIFPYFDAEVSQSLLLGASGSIMAIIVASAVASPNLEMRVLFLGGVKLKYIALVAILTSFFGITSNNAGGEIAHLGGALTGYLFVVSLHKGKDITKWLNDLLDSIVNLFSRKKLKVKKTKYSTSYRKMTDEEFNMEKVRRMQEIDRILDKIKSSGYDSLTAEEKKRLFEQGKPN